MHFVAALLLVVGATACDQVDLKTAFEITELSSGYHDAGVTAVGDNKLVPSISFRLKNLTAEPIRSVDMLIIFVGVEFEQSKELDEVLITAINSDGIAAEASSEMVVVRSKQGFALQQQARSELFNHRLFRDVTAKLFLKRGGSIVPFGEYTIDRRVLLAAPAESTSR